MAEAGLVIDQPESADLSDTTATTLPLSNSVGKFPQMDPLATTTSLRASLRSTEDLKKQRESRAAESLRVKDEQIRLLQEQNTNLVDALDRLEDEAQTICSEKAAIEKENQKLRDNVAEFQSRARAAEATAGRVQAEISDKERQLKILTDQHAELLRSLQSEEELTANQQEEINTLKQQLEDAKRKQAALLAAAKSHEEVALRVRSAYKICSKKLSGSAVCEVFSVCYDLQLLVCVRTGGERGSVASRRDSCSARRNRAVEAAK